VLKIVQYADKHAQGRNESRGLHDHLQSDVQKWTGEAEADK
jgi:hypothetical protein